MPILDDIRAAVGRLTGSEPAADAVNDGAVWNPYTGGGGGKRVTDTRPGPPLWLSADEIDWLTTTDPLIRRLIYGPVQDAVGRGWRVDDGDDRDVTRDIDDRLGMEDVVSSAMASARQYGGCLVWMVTDDGADLADPLPPGEHTVRALHVLDQREARPFTWDQDPASPSFTRPILWDVSMRRDEVTASVGLVHASRLVYVPGLPMAASQASPPDRRGYDLSVPQAYWEAVRDLMLTHSSAAGLAVEKSMPWLRLSRKAGADAGGQGVSFRGAMQAWARARSSWGVTVLGDGDEIGRVDASMAGLREVMLAGYERVASLEGVPLSALIGQAPAGLSTDDASGQRTYARYIGRMRRLVAGLVLTRVYDVEVGRSPSREIVWPPVDPPTEEQAAGVAKTYAETDAILAGAGLAGDELRDRWSGPEVIDRPTVSEDDVDLPMAPEPGDDPDPTADAETYAVPQSARNNARRVLRWREEHGDEVAGMTEVGWRRARQLAGSARVGRDTVAAMASFNRHRGNYEAARRGDPDKPWTEAAIVAWLGWGGTSGIEWARDITGASED